MSCSSAKQRPFDHVYFASTLAGGPLRLVPVGRAPYFFARRGPLLVGEPAEVGEGRRRREMLAAVDRDGLAGEKLAGVRQQKHDEVLQFLHAPVAAERDRLASCRRGADIGKRVELLPGALRRETDPARWR